MVNSLGEMCLTEGNVRKKKFGSKKKTTHDHFWVKNPYKNSACQNKKNEGGEG